MPYGMLHLIYRCVTQESRELLRPFHSISFEDFFFCHASCLCPATGIEELQNLVEDKSPSCLIYALIGASDLMRSIDYGLTGYSQKKTRYSMMEHYLRKYLEYLSGELEGFEPKDASDGILLAWRCFLLHETYQWIETRRLKESHREQPYLDIMNKRNWLMADNKTSVERILELFIKCGVMTESPGPKYLIVVNWHELGIVKRPSDRKIPPKSNPILVTQGLDNHSSSTYCEVNDAQLLSQLAKEISTRSEPILAMRRDAFIRAILANNRAI